MISQISTYFMALLLASGVAFAQNIPCASNQSASENSVKQCNNKQQFLSAAVPGQEQSMPGMQMPAQQEHNASQPPAHPEAPSANSTLPSHQQHQSGTDMQMGAENMEMRSPGGVASDVSAVQEPENAGKQTGSDSPVTDLLGTIRTNPRKKLAEFEELALKLNPTLKQSEALVRSSAGLARQAGLLPNPIIGYEGAEIRGGEFGGGEHGAFIQQTFVLGGKLGLRRSVFEQQRKADELGVSEQKVGVLGAVRVQFYQALAAQQAVDVRARILKLTMDAAATAHQLANVGQADAPDVLQTEVEAEQAKIDFDSAQRQYIQAFRTLAAVSGVPEMALAMLDGDLESPPEIDPETTLAAILSNSPSMKRAQQEVHQAEAALKRDRREVIPDLTVRVGGQQNFEQTSAGRAAGYESLATASIQIPIFNRNQGNIAASGADLERAQSEVLRTQLSLTQEAQPLIQRYAATKLQADRYRTQLLPRAQRAYELYLDKYRHMGAAYPEVIISQRTFFQLQERYVRALGELWTISQELQNFLLTNGVSPVRASGGGGVNPPNGGTGSAQ